MALFNGVKYRLHVGRRLADDAQDIGSRGLPGQRLLGLVEQPRILDGDDCLVGKGLQESDLLVRVRPDFLAIYCDEADNELVFE